MTSSSSLPASPAPAYQYPNMGQAASGALGGTQNIDTQAQNVNSAYGSGQANSGATARNEKLVIAAPGWPRAASAASLTAVNGPCTTRPG